MGQPLPVVIIVAANAETANKYAELVRLSGVGELDIKRYAPQKGLPSFVDSLKISKLRNPTVLLTANVFSNCDIKPSLEQVLKTLSGDKGLDLRKIFVVRSHGMGDFKPDDMTRIGADGVYYGAGVKNKDFQDWIKRVWNKPSTSVHKEPVTKRSPRSEENALVSRILGDDERLPVIRETSSTPNSGKQVVHVSTPPIAKKVSTSPPRVAPAVPPVGSSWLFGNGGVSETQPDRDDGEDGDVTEPITEQPHTKQAQATEQQPTETKLSESGGSDMQVPLVDAVSQRILLRAFATACIAFGNSINQQMEGSGEASTREETRTAPVSAASEAKNDTPPPTPARERDKVYIEAIDGRHANFFYNDWELELPKGKADLLCFFIESKGRLIPYEEICERYELKKGSGNFSVNQKVSNLILELTEKAPLLIQGFVTVRGKGYRFQLPE
jgi:hypothetical protein